MIKHINLTVKGRVQGVWFRVSTKNQADRLGVKGFVKNRINGDVYIEAAGTEQQLQLFINWCKQGPPLADVNEIIEQKGTTAEFTNFSIK